jgi:hypothetical protein
MFGRVLIISCLFASLLASGTARAEIMLIGMEPGSFWRELEYRSTVDSTTARPSERKIAPHALKDAGLAPLGGATSTGSSSFSGPSTSVGPADARTDRVALRLELRERLRIARLLIPPDPDPWEILEIPKHPR